MDTININAWLALFSAAMSIGQTVYDGVKNVAQGELNDEEFAALELAWDEDVQRSALNAGIPASPDVPLA